MQPAVREILQRAVAGRGCAAVALMQTEGDRESVWAPAELHSEPLFLAYSVTKTFTATLLLLLHAEGRLSIDAPLARWFPRIQLAEKISLRMLLNHTAGIPDYGGLAAYHESVRTTPQTPWNFDRFAQETYDKGLLFAPGEGWGYSNPGYMLLKRIAEEAGEETLARLFAQKIFGPLGLERTFVPESLAELASLAPAESSLLSPDRAPRDVRHYYHPGWVSHGVVASSPSEIVLFFDALFSGRILAKASLDAMKTLVPAPASPAPRWKKPCYGLGLMGNPESPWGILWGHNGGGPGYQASAFHVPALGNASVCVMAAMEAGFSAEELAFEVLKLLASTA